MNHIDRSDAVRAAAVLQGPEGDRGILSATPTQDGDRWYVSVVLNPNAMRGSIRLKVNIGTEASPFYVPVKVVNAALSQPE